MRTANNATSVSQTNATVNSTANATEATQKNSTANTTVASQKNATNNATSVIQKNATVNSTANATAATQTSASANATVKATVASEKNLTANSTKTAAAAIQTNSSANATKDSQSTAAKTTTESKNASMTANATSNAAANVTKNTTEPVEKKAAPVKPEPKAQPAAAKPQGPSKAKQSGTAKSATKLARADDDDADVAEEVFKKKQAKEEEAKATPSHWVARQVSELEPCREVLWGAVEQTGAVRTDGAFYFLVPLPPAWRVFDSGDSSSSSSSLGRCRKAERAVMLEAAALKVLGERFKVVVTPGSAFGCTGFFRASYGSLPNDQLAVAAQRLNDGLAWLAQNNPPPGLL